MRFIDEAIIEIAGGNGGQGCICYTHVKKQLRGKPTGGNGGRGGHVILEANTQIISLADHSYLRYFHGENGKNGQKNNKIGETGKNKIVKVPIGTTIFNHVTGDFLIDLTKNGQKFIAAYGGRGGKGNQYFDYSTRHSQKNVRSGEIGEKYVLRLELKIFADVGLIGLPNAGKSSLIRTITAARPKIADYPFTTLSPHLGANKLFFGKSIIFADIPGLVAGAHQGIGLGLKFLKHVKRTRLFVYVIDMSNNYPIADLITILTEIRAYDSTLLDKAGIVVANKLDLPCAIKKMNKFKQQVKNMGFIVLGISTCTKQGITTFLTTISDYLT